MTPRRLVLLLVVLGACRDPARLNGTALLVTTDGSDVEVDQLRYAAVVDGGALFEPAVRPEAPGDVLAASTSVRILLRDEWGGLTADVQVTGLRSGVTVGEGSTRVTLETGVERVATVKLLAPTSSCSGCVSSSGACVTPSPAACGVGGASCVACDGLLTDTCSEQGRCACGDGPPCSAALGADRCVQGQCRCGAGPACEAGQECLQQACQCTPASCAGCCIGNQCVTSPSSMACGTGGRACLDCGTTACSGGQCGLAVCNATTCPTGCCQGSTCVAGRSATACGTGGAACESCGVGSCGDGGVCIGTCNAQTCPSGCCQGGVCLPGDAATACGTGGGACATCTTTCVNQRCSQGCDATTCPTGCCQNGVCRSGSQNTACGTAGAACIACGAGTTCSAGTCVTTAMCNANTCAQGCCDGTSCVALSATRCGALGRACVSCGPPLTDRCLPTGTCGCGSSAACEAGQRCAGGVCVCDSTSCGGCCDGSRCVDGTRKQACGSDGGVCRFCQGSSSCEMRRCQ